MSKNGKKKEGNILVKLGIFFGILFLTFALCYYFLGLVEGGIITIGLFFVLLIGYFLDKPKTKSKRRKVVKAILILVLVFSILGLLAGCGFLYYVVKKAPDFKEELFKTKESTIIYDSEGREYAKLGLELRENIEYDEISEVFIDALVATEDSRFFQHNGFDLMRFVKAAAGQAMGQGDSGGGSTLTMQLSKNTLTSTEASGFEGIVRKFTDIYISIFQIERNYTKEQIIEFYANKHTLGGVIYGVQEAARYFFNKDAKDLNISEAAVIAGMYQAPSKYNPFNHPQAAEKRRNNVLYYMRRHGYITEEEYQYAKSIPVESLLEDTSSQTNAYQGYIDLVCKEMKEKYGLDPYSTPMLVYTNMVRANQDGINKIYNQKKTGSFQWKDDDMQAGIAVLNSTNGKIVAIGAGRNRSGAKSYSYATDINRQIGSTAKPLFDYGPGIEYNNWSTATTFKDEPYSYSNGTKIHNWQTSHDAGGEYAGWITIHQALTQSRNVVALKAFQQVDNKKIIEYVTNIGITPEIVNGYIHEAHAIGAFTGSNPLAMAGAYQIYSNGGYYYEPYAVSKIVFRDGETETIEYSAPKVRAISDSTSYMMTRALDSILDGYAKSGLSKDHMVGKTGTTNVDDATIRKKKLPGNIVRDFWIVGFTPNTVISVWIGYDELNAKHNIRWGEGRIRSYLFNQVARVCFKHDNANFVRPKSVVAVSIEKGSHPPKLPSANTPDNQKITEYFKRGTEPTEVSTKYLSANAPSNLTVKNHDTYVTLSWTGVPDPEYVEDGVFGYYVYYNGKELGFTQATTYTVNNLDDYYGTYSVRAGYKDNTDSALSSPATYELSKITYHVSVSQNSVTYNTGDTIDNKWYNGSVVTLYAGDTPVTSNVNISPTITDSAGNKVSTPSSSSPNTYTVSYKVEYEGKTYNCSNKIIVKEKEVTPPPTPSDDNNNESDT